VDLYIHSPIRLDGIMLNWLSTGTTLPLFYRHVAIEVKSVVSEALTALVMKRYVCLLG
jgi:hypothetical protein